MCNIWYFDCAIFYPKLGCCLESTLYYKGNKNKFQEKSSNNFRDLKMEETQNSSLEQEGHFFSYWMIQEFYRKYWNHCDMVSII
jgi:hypothetical protein